MAAYSSELNTPTDRLLAQLIWHAFDAGWRSPDDFLQHFSASDIVNALADAEDLRVRILCSATGVHEKIAGKKSLSSAAEDLQLALDEGTTTPTDLLADFPVDDRVKVLDAQKLWNFLVEDDFFDVDAKADNHENAASRVQYTLECSLEQKLLTLAALTDGIGFQKLAEFLPPEPLRRLVVGALEAGRDDQALTEELLFDIIPLEELVRHVPLNHTWNEVIVDLVAKPADWLSSDAAASSGNGIEKRIDDAMQEALTGAKAPSGTGGGNKKGKKKKGKAGRESVKPSGVAVASSTPASGPAPAKTISAPPPTSEADREALAEVSERLRGIERLPEDFETLTLPVLYSIDSMYADLEGADDDDEKIAIIEDSFPNETHLRTAMLAMIRLLDSTVNTDDPVVREADPEALIKIFLAEERRRQRGSRHSGVAPAVAGSVPPPIPGAPRGPESLDVEIDDEGIVAGE